MFERERTQYVRVARSNRSGVQPREPSDRQPEQWFVRFSLCLDDSCDVQVFCETKGSLGGEVCCYYLGCVAIYERHRYAGIRQPNLRSVVSSSQRRKMNQNHTIQGASGTPGLTSLPARCGKLDSALLSATLNRSISKISGTMCAVGTCSKD